MKKIITLGGSNSKASINKKLAEYTGGLIENVTLQNIDLNDYEMPMYSIDHENEKGFSETILSLNKIFDSADGFIISLAEHNGAYSAVFKNTYDWLSRIEAKVWRDKPMILLSTSPGGRGGETVLNIALEKFPRMGAKIIGSLSLPSFFDNFKDGEVVDANLKSKIDDFVKVFENEI